jgi:hypothetical protein
MAGLSLWQLLNQRGSLAKAISYLPQQQQSPGQAIGQSLNEFWDRAKDDGSDYQISDPSVSDDASLLQPPPFYPDNVPNDRDLPLLMPLAGRYFSKGSSELQPDAPPWGDQERAPIIQLAGARRDVANAARDAFVKYGPLIGPAISEAWKKLWESRSSPSPDANPSTSLPSPLPTSVEDRAPANADSAPTSPSSIGDFTIGSTSPFEDSHFLPRFEAARTPEQEREFPGDYSNGRHRPFIDFQIDSLRKAGCTVEPNMRLGSLDDPRIAIADWMHQCFDQTVPTVGEGKTGRGREFSTNQNVVYPAVASGRGYSPSPRIATFGFTPWSQLPPLPVMRSWSPWHGAPIREDYPFGGAP